MTNSIKLIFLSVVILCPTTLEASCSINNACCSSSSGGGTWGSITGTLSSQTDLNTELNAKIADPGAVTDDGIVTWDGTGGATVQSQSEFKVVDSGATTITPVGTVTGAGLLVDLGSSTSFTYGIQVQSGQKATNALELEGSYSVSANRKMSDFTSTGTSTSGYFFTQFNENAVACTGNTLGWVAGPAAFCSAGSFIADSGAGSAGTQVGVFGLANNGIRSVGGSFGGIAAKAGANNKAVGVHAVASGENSAQTIGLFTKIMSANSNANLENYYPTMSAALIADNGDTTFAIADFLDNDISVVSIADGGNLLLGKGISIAPSSVDLTSDDQSVVVTTSGHVRFTSDNSTATNRTIVLGNGSVDGQRLALEWAEDTATGAGELPDNTANNVRLSAIWTPGQYDTLNLVWNSADNNWLEISRSDN